MKLAWGHPEFGPKAPSEAFLRAFAARSDVRLVEPSAAVLALPWTRDVSDSEPADRMTIATAPGAGARVVASDPRLLDHLDDALAG